MRRRSFGGLRSRSACCPSDSVCRPGCRLPCCAPTQRCGSTTTKRNRCIFVPAPGRTTRRYCGDPCSPPPPACTPKPVIGSSCYRPRKPRSPCASACNPCGTGRRRARSYNSSRPFRPFSQLYSSTDPCRPRKFGPLDPCVPSRCDPCLPRIGDLCCSTLPSCRSTSKTADLCGSPSCYKANKCKKPCASKCDPFKKSRKSRCRTRRSASSRRSSSCGSSYCDSSYSRNDYAWSSSKRASLAAKCQNCERDPCCCSPCDNGENTLKCSPCDDTSKGPTSWFLKKSDKVGKTKSPTEPHFCPWEAEVTVTGTVRGHCTSTAVEVAKRLTGKFSSRGQRYTYKKDANCDDSKTKDGPQRMTMGYLDDGTKLDFSRNRCEDDDGEDFCQDRMIFCESRTNNTQIQNLTSSNKRNTYVSDGHLKVRERKQLGKEDVTFATAYIGGGAISDKTVNHSREKSHQDGAGVCTRDERYRNCRQSHRKETRHRPRRRHSRARPVLSDTDQSSYKTAPETLQGAALSPFTRRHLSHCTQGTENFATSAGNTNRKKHAERHGRSGYRRLSPKEREARRLKNSHVNGLEEHAHRQISRTRQEAWHRRNSTSADLKESLYNCHDDSQGENDIISFNLVSEDDCDDGFKDNYDDVDDDTHHQHNHSPLRRSMADICAREADRRYSPPIRYSSRSKAGPVSRTRHSSRYHNRTSDRLKYPPDLAHTEPYSDSGQSSEEEFHEGRSSNHSFHRSHDRPQWDRLKAPRSRYLSQHRKGVTYGNRF